MADEQKKRLRLEIAHVLFMDIVGYSKLLTDEQSEALHELNQIVRNTEAARAAKAAEQLTILPTGDGMALVFTGSVEEPAECALEISHALRAQPSLPVRMGIHSGPIHHVKDANQRENIAGVGINIAQRVMDCGDAGHILVSKRVADDLAQQRRWQPYLHELGDVEVKHGVIASLVNFYAETIGNPTPPARIGKVSGISRSRVGTRNGLSPLARSVFIVASLLIVLAIVSLIFAPAIMRTLGNRQVISPPQVPATPSPSSFADTIKSEVAKKISDELQDALSRKKESEVELKDALSRRKNASAEPSVTVSGIPEKSIAVMPFENLSSDKENAYFTDGIQEEILTRLSKIADLTVISRTSTQRYRSAPENLPKIARELGVAYILEGAAQKAANQVRVNVQLINAQSDSHLWAEKFDRKLTDIFAVESEIAAKIADALQAKLTGSEQQAIAAHPTENIDAHELYLKARYFWSKQNSADLEKAIDYFNQTIAQDPHYAAAYAGLADCYMLLPFWKTDAPADSLQKAKGAAQKALQIDDSVAEAHVSLANVSFLSELNLTEAKREFERGQELNPNYATAHHWFATTVLLALGETDRAIAELKRARQLDPFSVIINANLGYVYMLARRYPDSISQLHQTIELNPKFFLSHRCLAQALEMSGQVEQAIREYEQPHEPNDEPYALAFRAHAYASKGDREKALELLGQMQELGRHRKVWSYGFALVYLGLGDKNEAINLLERDYREKDYGHIFLVKLDPMLDPLRGDRRFEALVQKILPPKSIR